MGALDRVAARVAAAEARLDALAAPAPAFQAERAEARARFLAMGLPGRRDEYWRFADAAPLSAPTLKPAGQAAEADARLLADRDSLTIAFTDGRFDPALSSPDLAGQGIEVQRLATLKPGAEPGWAKALFGRLELLAQTPVPRPFATLATAAATDGILLRVTGRVERPVHLDYRHSGSVTDAVLHHLVQLEPDAELTLLETGSAAHRFVTLAEVDVAKGARFHHVRLQGPDPERLTATAMVTRLARGATAKSFTLAANGRLTRNEAVIEIAGDGAVAHVAGAALGDGADVPFLHDDTVFVTHGAVGCESRQVFKKVLRNGAVGTFQGKILVRSGAQKTDGYQISQALLLDDGSQFLGKPELEIYADDVKCSHGSTTGAIDETALFYLRSRGVPREDATALLVLSFLADAIAEVEEEALREAIVARLEEWLSAHRTALGGGAAQG